MKINFGALLLLCSSLGAMEHPKRLLQKQPVSDVYSIFQAAAEGKIKVIQRMINEHADLNQKDRNGNTPLLLAARAGRVDVVNALIKGGADLSIKNNADQNAIFIAVEHDQVAVVRALLKAGVSANQREIHGLGGGRTLLMIATQKGNTEMVRVLTEAGADTGARKLGLVPHQQKTAGEMAHESHDEEMKAYTQWKKEKLP